MNVTKSIAMVLLACLAACSSPLPPPNQATASTAIGGAKMDRSGQQMLVTVHVYRNLGELHAAWYDWYKKNGIAPPTKRGPLGWSVWSPNDNVCDIHITQVRDVRDNEGMITAGHELSHCLYGSFHSE